MDGIKMAGLSLVRLLTIGLCFAVFQVMTLNHFLYVVLKERYGLYQAAFCALVFALSVFASPPWNLSKNRIVVTLLLCGVGYLSSVVAFWLALRANIAETIFLAAFSEQGEKKDQREA